jgi:serine/threonine-protein kinase
MRNKIIFISLLSLASSVSACVDEGTDDTNTAEAKSALSGGPWTWRNTATLRCLDSNSSGSVYTLDCNGGDFQLWTNSPLGFGDQIIDKATNRCLDSDTSGHVYTLPCNGGAFQQWTVRNTGSFGFEIKDVATGLCLDSNSSGSVYTLGCNAGNFQRWL